MNRRIDFDIESVKGRHGRVAIVTGANSGIGFYTALGLAKAGYTVVMACKSVERAAHARIEMQKQAQDAELDIIELNLASFASIRSFVHEFKLRYERLDLLINNAGILFTPYQKTVDGFEGQFGINYLGHFLLTSLLIDSMVDSTETRIVTVSSLAHKMAKLDLNDFVCEKHYHKFAAYHKSKLACLVFSKELDRRLKRAGKSVLSVAAHPGVSTTGLWRNLRTVNQKLFNAIAAPIVAHDPKHAAMPTLLAALYDDAKGGDYFGPVRFFEMLGEPGYATVSKRARSASLGVELFNASIKATEAKWNPIYLRAEE